MRVSILVALTPRRVIGFRGGLPWHLPADLAHFKRTTMGHHVVMGRRTFESLGRPLPGRTILVLTRQPPPPTPGVHPVASLDEALAVAAAGGGGEVFIAGGGEVYRLALPRVERIYQTVVHADLDGDTTFPEPAATQWQCVERRERDPDPRNAYRLTFEVWDRIAAGDP